MIYLLAQLIIPFFLSTSNLIVTVENVNVDKGYIYVALYSKDKGFPTSINESDKVVKVKAKTGKVKVYFNDLNKGDYSISVFHDVNSDKVLNTSFIGIPKEPIGVSNNAKGFMGPPSFEACLFNLEEDKNISVRLKEL